MKRPQQVLAGFQIDARLAAHGGVDLRQQRGRNLHHGNAAHEDGSQERAHIAHHAASQSEQYRLPVGAVPHHFGRKFFQLRERLPALAVGHYQ